MIATKRVLSFLLILTLILSYHSALAITPADEFRLALSQLNYYLTVFDDAYRNEDVSLTDIANSLKALGSYSSASGFYQYTCVLMYLENSDYRAAYIFKEAIKGNELFSSYILSDEFTQQYPSIRSLDELATYVDARIAENSGNVNDAVKLYQQCSLFFDSSNRMFALLGGSSEDMYNDGLDLMRAGNYQGAYKIFKELAKFGYLDSALYESICLSMLKEMGLVTPTPTPKSMQTPSPTPTPTPTPKPVNRQRYAAGNLGTGTVYQNGADANAYFSNIYGTYFPSNAFDQNVGTSWIYYQYGDNISGVWLSNTWTLNSSYADKYNACGLKIRIGLQSRGQNSYSSNSRPRDIAVTVNGSTSYYTLDDTMGEQVLSFSEVSPRNGRFDVRIQVNSVYHGELGTGYTNTSNPSGSYAIAISEIDLMLINNY